MRYLIVSDLHANWEALDAVLHRAEGRCDRILCLGDVIGYGADPNAVTDWTRANAHITIRGNHDKVCTGLDDLEWFNAAAQRSAIWTRSVLTPENLQWLRDLARGPVLVENFQIMHGSPLDEDEYLIHASDVSHLIGYLESPLSFFGHTHIQGGFALRPGGVQRLSGVAADAERMEMDLSGDDYLLINPGSVGQPRDGDPRAAYVIYDSARRVAEFYRAPYDIAAAQRKIMEANLPPLLARRLAAGL